MLAKLYEGIQIVLDLFVFVFILFSCSQIHSIVRLPDS